MKRLVLVLVLLSLGISSLYAWKLKYKSGASYVIRCDNGKVENVLYYPKASKSYSAGRGLFYSTLNEAAKVVCGE